MLTFFSGQLLILFLKIYLFIYLATLGLRFGMQDLCGSIQNLPLQCLVSGVVAHELSSCGSWA